MNEPPPALPPEPAAPAPSSHPTTSLWARLMNIFAIPGDVFDEVKTSAPAAGNWVVPAILGAVVGILAVVVIFSQPAVVQKIREQQEQAIEKRLGKLVKEGKMTQQDVEKQKEMAEKFMGPTVMKISGGIAAVFWSFARIFLLALVLWLLGRWLLRSRFPYMKAAEVVGLAAMIGVLGTIVKLLLQVNFSDPASSPSLAIFIKAFDPKNPLHMVLAALNLFDVWELAVMALGLARLAGAPFARAGVALFGFWVFWSALLIALSTVVQKMFG